MPRTRPLGDQWESEFRAKIFYFMGLDGIRNKAELAKRMGIPQSTLSRHLKEPAMMSVGELRKMAKVLGVPQEEVGKMIKGGKNET